MKTKTITTPDFMDRTAKIIAEVSAKACVDKIDTEVIEAILQASLNEYCTMVNGYYKEAYYTAISSARHRAYDAGHSDGYSLGYDDGYSLGYDDGHAKNHSAV